MANWRTAGGVVTLYGVLCALDVATTWIALRHGGVERNPVSALLIAHAGLLGLSLGKLVFFLLFAAFAAALTLARLHPVLSPLFRCRFVRVSTMLLLLIPCGFALLPDLSNAAALLALHGVDIPHL